MLDSHPHICCGPESGLFLAKPVTAARLDALARKFDLDASRLRSIFEASSSQAKFIEGFFEYYCELTRKRRWAEKTPRNVHVLEFVFAHFPNARFVHVIRDGRDVVCSLRTHPRFEVVDGRLVELDRRNPIGDCIERWVRDVRAGLAFRDHPAAIEVRYEDLVREPEATLRGLLGRLGEPWDDRVLRYHELVSPSRDVTKFPQNPEATRPLSESAIGRWRTELAPEEAELFKRRAGLLLIQLGYAQDLRWKPSEGSDLPQSSAR
jgi:protein-tyrosine sulfotransferase